MPPGAAPLSTPEVNISAGEHIQEKQEMCIEGCIQSEHHIHAFIIQVGRNISLPCLSQMCVAPI